MIYNLLKDMQKYLQEKSRRTVAEQDMLDNINHALPAMLRKGDNGHLFTGELLVRICPDTGHPVLVCHDGEGQCLCLHNETIEEDGVDVEEWLKGKRINAERLLETVADLAYNAGADNLYEDMDSRTVLSGIVHGAYDFERVHAGTDWDEEDYLLAVDEFYRMRFKDDNKKENK